MEEKSECANCGVSEHDQALVNHGNEYWCLDCMRLAGLCITCDVDIRTRVDDYYNYEADQCPECLKTESHDRHINDNTRYLLFSNMSSEHGLTLLDSELDEIARHAAPMTGVEYWKERCKVAEQMIGICPSDPKTYDEFCRLYDEWEQLIEQNQWPR